MDVLHLIKIRHERLIGQVRVLDQSNGVKARRAVVDELTRDLESYQRIQQDYFYPELLGLFPESDSVVTMLAADAAVLSRRLKALGKVVALPVSGQSGAYEKKFGEFRTALEDLFLKEERDVMPRLRTAMRTEEREDLGQVIEEMESDLRAGLLPEPAAKPVPGRRRA